MKKIISAILCILMIASLAVSAFADGPSGDVEIAMHFAPGSVQAEVFQEIVDAFMVDHPEIKVTVQYNGNENMSKMKTRFAAGDAPDIIWTSPSDMLWYCQSDLLAPVDDVFNGDNYDGTGKVCDDFKYQAVVDMNTVDGKLMALPVELCAGSWYYNKALYAELGLEIPKTWDEFVSNNAALLEAGISPIAADGNVDYYLPWYFTNLSVRLAGLDAYENALLNKDSSVWDNPAFLKAAQLVAEGVTPYFQPGMKGTQYPASNALFAQSIAAQVYCASWFPQEIVSITPEDFEYGLFTFPEVDGAVETRQVVEMKANSYVLAKDAKNPEAAKVVLQYLVSKKGMEPLVKLDMLPAVKDIEVPEIQKEILGIFDSAEVGVPIHFYLFDPDYKDWASAVIFPANNLLCYGEITPEDFIAKVKADNDTYWAAKA